MLVLSREKSGAVIVRCGEQVIRVVVVELRGNRVRLGFEADKAISIDREEVDNAKQREHEAGSKSS